MCYAMQLELESQASAGNGAFIVTGLALAGAIVTHGNVLQLSEVCMTSLAAISLVKILISSISGPIVTQSAVPTPLKRTLLRWVRTGQSSEPTITLPAYRHGNRQHVLFSVNLQGTGLDGTVAALRAVSLICSPLA
jgi:hypothetical protein